MIPLRQGRAFAFFDIDFYSDEMFFREFDYFIVGKRVGIQPLAPRSPIGIVIHQDDFVSGLRQDIGIRLFAPGKSGRAGLTGPRK